MLRSTFFGQLFQLLLDDEGGGGGIGDVSDIPHGQSGDVEIMNRTDDEGDEGDDDEGGDDEGDQPDKGKDKKKGKSKEKDDDAQDDNEGDRSETFDTDEEDESDDEDDDEEGEDDEEDDKEVFKGRPRLSDLKKAFPDIYKKFPELRDVITREYKLSQVFGTVEEAEEAGAKVENFNTIEAALLAGDSTPILDQLAENDPEALAKVVENFLPAVIKKSQDLYLVAAVPIIEQLLHNAYTNGKQTNNKNLMLSAQHIAQFMFNKPDIPDPARRGQRGPSEAEQRLEAERATWKKTRFNEASQEVSGAIDAELEAEILKGLDPDKKLSKRQRASLIKEIKDEIDATLGKDEAHKRQMAAMWKKAASADYPRDQRGQIKNAFLARAKALVPSVRTRLRAEWFGDEQEEVSGDKNKDRQQGDKKKKKRQLPDSGQAGGGGPKRPPTPGQVNYDKTSDMDLIEGRFVRR